MDDADAFSPDLAKLRRFAMTVALLLAALVVADVRLKVPLEISPLGIPLVIGRPYLLTGALAVAAVYATLRYIYYGMLVHPSPMRARRQLQVRTERRMFSGSEVLDDFQLRAARDVDRYFPKIGGLQVTFEVMQDATGSHVKNMQIPRIVRLMCWIENIDYVLPILANLAALGLWVSTQWNAS